MQKYIFFNRA